MALEATHTSQDNCIFNLVHSKQEEGWQLEGAEIAIYTNPSFKQQEHKDGIILLNNNIAATV